MGIKHQSVQRISINPEIYHGKPCVRGTRMPVYVILELIQYGLSFVEIIEEYPHISKEDIQACLEYAIGLMDN